MINYTMKKTAAKITHLLWFPEFIFDEQRGRSGSGGQW